MASFRKLATGWEYRVSYKGNDGKYHRKVGKGFKTKIEATQAAAQIELDLAHPEIKAREISLADFVEQWAEIYKKPHVKERTWQKYKVVFNNVRKYFGDTPIGKITNLSYQEVFNELSTHYTQETLKNLHVPIKSAVKVALRDRVLTHDFTDGAIIKSTVENMPISEKFLEEEEYLHVIEVTEKRFETPSYFFIYLVAMTGMRFSEALGVTWSDINFKDKVLSVNKTYDQIYTHDFATTKNVSSNREIPLSENTVKALKNYKKNFWVKNNQNRLIANISSNAVNKTLRHIVERKVHVHSLRHTYASFLISKQIELISISKILGHKDLTITLEVYAHQLDALKEKNHSAVRKVFDSL
ncbi:site-specific integrase [Lactovum odontotermitis]